MSESGPALAIALRRARTEDREFLFDLLRAALGPYIEQSSGWRDDEQRARFEQSPRWAVHEIVELAGERIGCLDVERHVDVLKLNRLFLLPAHQRNGIGSRIAREVLAEADAARLPVRLRVLKVNPAQSFWRRHGFAVIGETDKHVLMERRAGAPPALS